MASIKEHKSKMTIFYSKRDGSIKGIATGIQDMSIYGSNTEDFKLIRDYIVVDLDRGILDNPEKFQVNTETKEIELIEEYAFQPKKYKIASRNANTKAVIEAEKSMED